MACSYIKSRHFLLNCSRHLQCPESAGGDATGLKDDFQILSIEVWRDKDLFASFTISSQQSKFSSK